jgi:hypothetical protein
VFVCLCVCVCVCVYQDLEDLEMTDQERLLASLSYEALQELQVGHYYLRDTIISGTIISGY